MQSSPGTHGTVATDQQPTPGPFSKLPIEWLVQILEWLPTQCLFQIISTNREWECGSRFVLKNRESLKIVWRESEDWDAIVVSDTGKLTGAVTSILKSMENVTRLVFHDPHKDHDTADLMRLVTAFAGQLVELDVELHFFYHRENPVFTVEHRLVFPNLERFACYRAFDGSMGATCFPKLRELKADMIKNGSHANAKLPMLQKLFLVEGIGDGEEDDVDAFLTQNSGTLTSLRMDNFFRW